MWDEIFWILSILGVIAMAVAGWLLNERPRLAEAARSAEAERREAVARAERVEGVLGAAETRAREAEARAHAMEVEAGKLAERLEGEKSRYEARVAEIERSKAEQLKRDEQRLKEINESYQMKLDAITAKALRESQEQFLKLANETFTRHQSAATAEIDKRRKAFEEYVKPIGETLKKTDERLTLLDKARAESQAALKEHLEFLSKQTMTLGDRTQQLVNSLKRPEVRGRWGEMALRNIVELAGMSEHCDFQEQASADSGEGRFRPDMIVRLPGERQLVVDAKAPIQAYLEAIEAETDEQRVDRLRAHAKQLKSRVDDLSSKKYQQQFDGTMDFVVLFVPGDQFLSAALLEDPSLLEYAAGKQVILTTPATLIALLKAVGYGWSQASLAEDAREIIRLGRDLHERLGVMSEHLAKMGTNLSRTVDTYNRTVGSLESRVLPAARRMEEHNLRSGKEIAALEPVGVEPRLPAGAGE